MVRQQLVQEGLERRRLQEQVQEQSLVVVVVVVVAEDVRLVDAGSFEVRGVVFSFQNSKRRN